MKYEKFGSNAFEEFESISNNRRNITGDILVAYEKHYMELLKKYLPEINEINSMLETVRKDRQKFYTQDLPSIIKTLDSQNINDTEKKIWLEELRKNLENSFRMSENLISHYVTKNLDDFETELKRLLNKV